MEVVRDTCDFVAVLDNGEVAETGTVEGIFTHPTAPVTRDFLSHLAPESALGPGNAPELVRWSKEGGKYLLRFQGPKTGEPVMSTLARRFDVAFNIRAGGVQRVGRTDVGTLVTDITGPEADAALCYLRDQGILVEELPDAVDAVGVTNEREDRA
jgi:D-methionine transport system ATP-binding protein